MLSWNNSQNGICDSHCGTFKTQIIERILPIIWLTTLFQFKYRSSTNVQSFKCQQLFLSNIIAYMTIHVSQIAINFLRYYFEWDVMCFSIFLNIFLHMSHCTSVFLYLHMNRQGRGCAFFLWAAKFTSLENFLPQSVHSGLIFEWIYWCCFWWYFVLLLYPHSLQVGILNSVKLTLKSKYSDS